MRDLINQKFDAAKRTDEAADSFVYLVASDSSLGDSIADMLDDVTPRIHEALAAASHEARLSPELFLVHVGKRIKARQYNDVQVRCLGKKLCDLLTTGSNQDAIKELERDLQQLLNHSVAA